MTVGKPEAGATHAHHHSEEAGELEHRHPTLRPASDPLSERSGEGKILFVDAFSGVAGDMFAAALVDLGVPFEYLVECVGRLPLDGVRIEVEDCVEGSLGARRFHVHVGGKPSERSYGDIDAMLSLAALPEGCKMLARRIFQHLAEAESRVHRVPLHQVHFHEVGAVDSIVDIVSAAAGLGWVGARVVSSPLPMGRGSVMSRHGLLPLPAPATLYCLEGVPTVPADINAELVTPTGAAIIATVATEYVSWPAFSIDRIGWGAGTHQLENRPNVLRLLIGTPNIKAGMSAAERAMTVIEANVDDMSGELAGYAIDSLLGAGAVDACAIPTTMKKGRPGLTISAIAPSARAASVVETLLRETTTIGVRQWSVARTERPRRTLVVATDYGDIPIKVSEGPFGPPQVKPEFDACVAAARQRGVPVRVVIEAALSASRRG